MSSVILSPYARRNPIALQRSIRGLAQAARYMRRWKARRNNQPNETRSRTANSAVSATDNPLTTQHDFKVDYRRRKRTRRLRRRIRRGKKFIRRVVNSYLRATESPKHVVKLAQFTRIAPEGQSRYFACMLHSADGTNSGDNPQADWREFFREGSPENVQGWESVGDMLAQPVYPAVSRRGRAIRSNSASMELTFRNTGETSAILSVYRIVCKKDWQYPTHGVEDMYGYGFRYAGRVTEHDQPVEDTTTHGQWDLQMQPTELTSTPFQSFMFTRHFTIYRRTKYQLAPGEEINLLVKSNRPRVIYMDQVRGKSVVRGLTHGFFVDFQGVPTYNGTTTSTSSAQISVQKMSRYSLTMMPEKRPATSYDLPDP